MAHRMACQHPDLINAVVSVSGPLAFNGQSFSDMLKFGQYRVALLEYSNINFFWSGHAPFGHLFSSVIAWFIQFSF